jgi:hypothetical protein
MRLAASARLAFYLLFTHEKLCPFLETERFTIAIASISFQAFLRAKLPQHISVTNEAKSTVTLIAAVRCRRGCLLGCLGKSPLHFFHCARSKPKPGRPH